MPETNEREGGGDSEAHKPVISDGSRSTVIVPDDFSPTEAVILRIALDRRGPFRELWAGNQGCWVLMDGQARFDAPHFDYSLLQMRCIFCQAEALEWLDKQNEAVGPNQVGPREGPMNVPWHARCRACGQGGQTLPDVKSATVVVYETQSDEERARVIAEIVRQRRKERIAGWKAQCRARDLLNSWLPPEQRERLAEENAIVIETRAGARYKIHCGKHANVCRVDADGHPLQWYCLTSSDVSVPDEDVMLAQYLTLQNDEADFLTRANIVPPEYEDLFRPTPPPEGTEAEFLARIL